MIVSAEAYGSDEESMMVSRERALESIGERMDMAFMRGDEDEYRQLEQLQRHTGFL